MKILKNKRKSRKLKSKHVTRKHKMHTFVGGANSLASASASEPAPAQKLSPRQRMLLKLEGDAAKRTSLQSDTALFGKLKSEEQMKIESEQHKQQCDEVPDPDSFKIPIAGFIFIGSHLTSANIKELNKHNVTHILNVNSIKSEVSTISNFTVLHLSMDDIATQTLFDNLYNAITFIDSVRIANGRIFVHCHAGISRSVSIVMCYLIWLQYASGKSPLNNNNNRTKLLEEKIFDKTLKEIQESRPCAHPNPGFRKQIIQFANTLISNKKGYLVNDYKLLLQLIQDASASYKM